MMPANDTVLEALSKLGLCTQLLSTSPPVTERNARFGGMTTVAPTVLIESVDCRRTIKPTESPLLRCIDAGKTERFAANATPGASAAIVSTKYKSFLRIVLV